MRRAAAGALACWRFEPARAGGKAIESRVSIPVIFRLSETGFGR